MKSLMLDHSISLSQCAGDLIDHIGLHVYEEEVCEMISCSLWHLFFYLKNMNVVYFDTLCGCYIFCSLIWCTYICLFLICIKKDFNVFLPISPPVLFPLLVFPWTFTQPLFKWNTVQFPVFWSNCVVSSPKRKSIHFDILCLHFSRLTQFCSGIDVFSINWTKNKCSIEPQRCFQYYTSALLWHKWSLLVFGMRCHKWFCQQG